MKLQPPAPIPPIDNRTFVADSAHYKAGRFGFKPKLILLHATETTDATGEAPSGPYLSTAAGSGVSCHHLYGRSGTRYDLVRRLDTAFHAGVAAWNGYQGSVQGVGLINVLSIGHELESTATLAHAGNAYTGGQITTLAYTVACEMFSYGIPWARVLTHAQVAQPPGRRHDPAWFPWDAFTPWVNAWLTFFHACPPGDVARWII